MRFIRRHKEILLLLTLVFFFASLFVGVGSVVFVNSDERNLAAKVGKSKIPNKSFQMNFRQAIESIKAMQPNQQITPEVEQALQNDVLRELIVRELFALETDSWGIQVTPREIAEDIARRPIFHRDGKFDPNLYYQFLLRTLGTLPREFEKERAKEIANVKFRSMISWVFPPTPSELQWLYQIERPTGTPRDFEREVEIFARQKQSELAIATLNQYLIQLSQKYQIKTYLNQQPAQ